MSFLLVGWVIELGVKADCQALARRAWLKEVRQRRLVHSEQELTFVVPLRSMITPGLRTATSFLTGIFPDLSTLHYQKILHILDTYEWEM